MSTIFRRGNYALQRAGTALKYHQWEILNAKLPVRDYMLMWAGVKHLKTHNLTKSWKNIRAIGSNTSITYNSTSQRIPLSSVSTKKNQIFVPNISFKLKSCLIPGLSLCTSFLTRPPTTRSPGTRGSSLTGSWVSLEAPWGFSLGSPSSVVSRSYTLPLGF